jgi:DNA polymerase-3 subunit gamma/tau
MSQALYRKWRPHLWEQVVGQGPVVQTLRNSVAAGRVAHAYLFAGPRGTGKTTTARLLAKAVNCLEEDLTARPCDRCAHCQAVNEGRFLDLIEIDAASNTSVEDVRDLRDKINFSPNQGRYKVYIIDEVHMLSTAAFNALLKTLEEPPSHAIFILATTEIHKIPATVLSRCQRHEFHRIPVADIVAHLREMGANEGLQMEDEALTLIARQCTGSLRDAISLLDQLASSGQKITLDLAQSVLGTVASQSVLDLVKALLDQNAATGLDQIHQALDAGSDPRQFARQVVDYLRNILLMKMGNSDQIDATREVKVQMGQYSQALTVQDLLRIIRAFNHAANDARSAWQPSLPLELAFVESLEKAPPEMDSGAASLKQTSAKPRSIQPLAKSSAQANLPADSPANMRAEQSEESLTREEVAEEGRLTLKLINDHWKQILALVRQRSPNTHGLLLSGTLVGVKDGVLYFGFSTEVLKSKMEKNENIDIFRQALQEAFGFDVLVRCIVSQGRGSLPPDVDSDGMVAAALRDLGGEIVDIQ